MTKKGPVAVILEVDTEVWKRLESGPPILPLSDVREQVGHSTFWSSRIDNVKDS
jgi:hypothetical protein